MARVSQIVPTAVTDEDKRFLKRFEGCTLPGTEWTHLAHLRVAWLCLAMASPDVALESIRAGILRYNTEVLKRRHQYHETVTVAFTRIVSDRRRPAETWMKFSTRINDITDTEKPVLLRFYTEERLFSEAARRSFIEPDLHALPSFGEN